MVIDRPAAHAHVREAFSIHPVVALTGPRQCGKTTLARAISASASAMIFDLESTVDRRRLHASEQTLAGLSGLVVIDEIQREAGLFAAKFNGLRDRIWHHVPVPRQGRS